MVTEQSGPLGATDTTSQLEASETATPDNTIVMELPGVAVGSHSGDQPMDLVDLMTHSKGKESVREDGQDESMVWPTNDKPVESPYWLRTNPKRKTHFSGTIVKMVKALCVVKLEEEEEDSLFALLPESYTSGTIPLTQAMRNNPLEWQAGLRSELISLIDAGTFKILKGPPLPGVKP